jgi:hypothetical protein
MRTDKGQGSIYLTYKQRIELGKIAMQKGFIRTSLGNTMGNLSAFLAAVADGKLEFKGGVTAEEIEETGTEQMQYDIVFNPKEGEMALLKRLKNTFSTRGAVLHHLLELAAAEEKHNGQ